MSPAAVKLAIMAAALAGAFGVGWGVNGWRLGAEVAQVRQEHAQEVQKATAAALAQLKDAQAQRDALAARLAGVDAAGTTQLRKVQDENETLRAAVAAGARRLRVAATCPARPADVPQAAAGSRVDTAAGPELTPDARRDYFALRAGIGAQAAQLAACQQSLREIGESPR